MKTHTALVALGGAIGAVARYWLTVLTAPVSAGIPWGTIGINVAGSFLIGVFAQLPAPDSVRVFVMVGICGGFTTFSAFSLQTLESLQTDAFGSALANIGASVLLCLAAVALGHHLPAGAVAKR